MSAVLTEQSWRTSCRAWIAEVGVEEAERQLTRFEARLEIERWVTAPVRDTDQVPTDETLAEMYARSADAAAREPELWGDAHRHMEEAAGWYEARQKERRLRRRPAADGPSPDRSDTASAAHGGGRWSAELMQMTRELFEPRAGRPLEESEVLEILDNARRFLTWLTPQAVAA